jgi:DNA-binding MarR family transcriptional regulator
MNRDSELDHISTHLLPAASSLARLLTRGAAGDVSRTEGGVLRSLSDGPRRITDLAQLEGLAQPTMTLLVKRLEQQGLVRRERQTDDQRVVLVSLTDAGRRALEHLRSRIRAALRTHLDSLPDERLSVLAAATDALSELAAALRGRA